MKLIKNAIHFAVYIKSYIKPLRSSALKKIKIFKRKGALSKRKGAQRFAKLIRYESHTGNIWR